MEAKVTWDWMSERKSAKREPKREEDGCISQRKDQWWTFNTKMRNDSLGVGVVAQSVKCVTPDL